MPVPAPVPFLSDLVIKSPLNLAINTVKLTGFNNRESVTIRAHRSGLISARSALSEIEQQHSVAWPFAPH